MSREDTSDAAIHLIVRRSFADYRRRWLEDAALEYRYRTETADATTQRRPQLIAAVTVHG